MEIDPNRIRKLNSHNYQSGKIVYWVSRDQRVQDNWALLTALKSAQTNEVELEVIFCLLPRFSKATSVHLEFMLAGLQEVASDLSKLGIEFKIIVGDPKQEIPKYVKNHKVGALITDFSPLRASRGWRAHVAQTVEIPMWEVDAHNIIPCWYLSESQEFAAHTIRPKVKRFLPEFLTKFPNLEKLGPSIDNGFDIPKLLESIEVTQVTQDIQFESGARASKDQLQRFINRISEYGESRNDPNLDAQSQLSPYLHFGQISAQRVALEVLNQTKVELPKDTSVKMWPNYDHLSPKQIAVYAFLEEMIVRRELADNFCYYNPNYDSPEGYPDWAKQTISEHKDDKREYTYSLAEFEQAKTHDELWNAAQTQMVNTGKMHGYLRMYWAKKILEWTPDIATAHKIAIYLNDKYELDGRDPNGYTGIAWSLGGVHDRAWTERDVFGKIRYMNYQGMKRKFDVEGFVKRMAPE